MSYSWWQYFVAWFAMIIFAIWIVVMISDLAEKIVGLLQHRHNTYNDTLIQQMYAENVNVDPTAPTAEYGATRATRQVIDGRRRK